MENSSETKLTINEIAALCGVSKTTVSRYLNGKYGNMSAQTRERIEQVVTGLDYHPNRTAQRLKSQKSMLIGCVIADAGTPFSALLLQGISAVCEKAGYQVLFTDSRDSPAREYRAIQGFLSSRVDGLLVNTTGGNNAFLSELKDKIPLVLIDRLVPDGVFDSVSSPDAETAEHLTGLLLDMGYEDVAFVSPPLNNITPRMHRCRGYQAAMEKAGLPSTVFEISSEDVEDCAGKFREFTARNSGRRTAVVCANGVAGLTAILAAYSLGMEIGYTFGCFTFDDWNWLKLAKPGISAVNLRSEEKGYRSAELLIRRIDRSSEISREAQHIIVEPRLIIRSSTVGENDAI